MLFHTVLSAYIQVSKSVDVLSVLEINNIQIMYHSQVERTLVLFGQWGGWGKNILTINLSHVGGRITLTNMYLRKGILSYTVYVYQIGKAGKL